MYGIIITLIVIAAVLLILVILAQNPKGGGLSSQFGGSGSAQLMGVKKTSDILEKITWGCAITIIALSISTNFFKTQPTQEELITTPVSTSGQDMMNIPSNVEPENNTQTSGNEDLNNLIESDSSK